MKCFEQKSTGSNKIYKKGKCVYCGAAKGQPHILAKKEQPHGGLEYYHGMEDMLGTNTVVWEKTK